MRKLLVVLALFMLPAVSACVRPALYSWGRYEDMIYQMYLVL